MHNIIELVKKENVGAFREAVRSELNRRLEKAYAALEPEAVSGLGLKYRAPMQEDFEIVSEEVIDIDAIRESLSEEDMKPECDPCPEEDEKDKIDDEREEFKAAGAKHRRKHDDEEEDEVLTERE